MEFIECFLACVVGQSNFKGKRAQQPISKIATISDEGFVLLVLENIWDMWIIKDIDEYTRNKGSAALPVAIGRRSDDTGGSTSAASASASCSSQSDKSTKQKRQNYACGKFTQNSASAKKFSGWSDKGLERFYEYCQQIKKIREDHKEFDRMYMDSCLKELLSSKTKNGSNKAEAESDKKVKVYVDLDDD